MLKAGMHVPSRVITCYLVCGMPETASRINELRQQNPENEIPQPHLARPDAAKGEYGSFPMKGDPNIDHDKFLRKSPIFSPQPATPMLDPKNHLQIVGLRDSLKDGKYFPFVRGFALIDCFRYVLLIGSEPQT